MTRCCIPFHLCMYIFHSLSNTLFKLVEGPSPSTWSTWYTVSRSAGRFDCNKAFLGCTKQNHLLGLKCLVNLEGVYLVHFMLKGFKTPYAIPDVLISLYSLYSNWTTTRAPMVLFVSVRILCGHTLTAQCPSDIPLG